jgi:outer membrane protein assembly factor BamB
MVLYAASANAQPFCGWRGENRDGIYNEKNLLTTWSETGPSLIWETLDAGKGYSSPVIHGDKLFLTGLDENEEKELFLSYSLDGKKLYQTEYGSPWKQSFSHSRTTPTIVGDKAYVISGMGEIACLGIADGKILWTVDAGTQYKRNTGAWGTAESPLVFDNKLIFSPGGDETTVVALNASTGELLWKSRSLNALSSYVSPLLISYKGKRQIVGMTDFHVYGINPENGEIQWSYDNWIQEHKTPKDRKICANTPLYKDGKIYVSNGYDQGSFQLALNDDLTAVKLVWKNDDLDTHIGGFVLVNGTIYGSSWTNNNQGDWVAVDWNTGDTKYKTAWTGKSKGSIISAEEMLYCYDERRGAVALVKATPAKFDIVSEFTITQGEGPHWAHPVINNGILYIRHGNALMAYKIR